MMKKKKCWVCGKKGIEASGVCCYCGYLEGD